MIVDVNQHWMPDFLYSDESFFNAYMRCIPRAYGEHVIIRDKPGANVKELLIQRPKGYENLCGDMVPTDTSNRLKDMDTTGVDKAILRWPIFPEWTSLEIAKRANDAMAKTVNEHPDRYSGLAMVPPWGDSDCVKEMERCIKELGFVGVSGAAHYGTLYLDEEEFRPHLKKVSELNVPLVVHHTDLPVDYDHIFQYTNLRRLYGRCIDQMTCIGRVIFSPLFQELPNLKFIHTMMGGGLFAFANLITPGASTVKGDRERFEPELAAKARGYLKNNVYLDITHAPPWGVPPLECAVKVLGAENILFGSSYPLRSEWLFKGVECVNSMDISDKDRSLILGENAARLFNLK